MIASSPYRLSLAAFFVLMSHPAMAYLGGFEEQDGYRFDGTIQDVSVYNAGQYGTNNGGPGGILTGIAPNTGLFVKGDIGNTAIDYGELVAHQGTGHTGNSYLVLRSSAAFGDTGNDGATYEYSFDSRDFDGSLASNWTTGQVTLEYWMCPQAQLFGTSQITRTEFLNGLGETVFAIGTRGQDNGTASPVIQKLDENDTWVDAETSPGSGTFVTGNNNGWDMISLVFDLDNDWVSFDYFSSVDQLSYSIAFQQALAGGRALDYLKGIRFNAVANTEKNSYDDFNIIAVVPEPSSALMLAVAGLSLGLRRRRR